MCWITYKPPSLCTTYVKIPVYKIMLYGVGAIGFPYLRSFFQRYEYHLNTLFVNKLELPCVKEGFHHIFYEIGVGIHSYSVKKTYFTMSPKHTLTIHTQGKIGEMEGYPCYSDVGRKTVIVRGYIPEGGRYYINECGEIVSDTIFLTKIIEIGDINSKEYESHRKNVFSLR